MLRPLALFLVTAAGLAAFLSLVIGLGWLRLMAGRHQASATADGGTTSSAPDSVSGGGGVATRPAAAPATQPATRPAEPTLAPPPAVTAAPPAAAAATLVGVDDATRGAWTGRYGRRGHLLAMDGAAARRLPAGVDAAMAGSQLYVWSPVTTDPRGLSTPEAPAVLTAGQWFAWDQFALDLDLRAAGGGGLHVALYLLDWDTDARAQRLDVVDPASGAVLLSRTDELPPRPVRGPAAVRPRGAAVHEGRRGQLHAVRRVLRRPAAGGGRRPVTPPMAHYKRL